MPARLISPATAFKATLTSAQRTESQGKATITKGEAEKALKQLDGPLLSRADQARTVQDFLDSKASGALSPRAKQVLADFVSKAGTPGGGSTAVDVQRAARDEAGQASRNLQKAQQRLETLIAGGAGVGVRSGLQEVGTWLDAAAADINKARAELNKIASHPGARLANRELGTAHKEITKAAVDVQALAQRAKGGGVKRADLEAVRAWLAEPLPELNSAQGALALGPPPGGGMHTMKYPSDNEDGGSQPIDVGGSGGTEPKKGELKPTRVDQLKKALNQANAAGSLQWHRGGVVESHLGVRFARVLLRTDRAADGFVYTAFVPVGGLNPTVVPKDPNTVGEFYVQRSGGLAGITVSAGPIKV